MKTEQYKFIIRLLCGKFGKGKGTVNTIIAIEEMRDEYRYEKADEEIAKLETEKKRTFARPPQKHVVFGNYGIKDVPGTGFERHKFDPDTFMLPNDDEKLKYNIFPPYSCFHIEEAHSEGFNAYDWTKFPKQAQLAFSRIRHAQFTFTMDLQFIENLNKNLRKYTYEYVFPLDIENKYDCFNALTQTTVHCAVFYNYDKAVQFELTQDKSLAAELRDYTFDGDIYKCFDSYSKKAEFYAVDDKKDFSY